MKLKLANLRKLSLEERKRLLHKFIWGDTKPYKGHGLESECDYYKIPKEI